MSAPVAALGRVTAFTSRLSFTGLLLRCRISVIHRGWDRYHVSLVWAAPDAPEDAVDAAVTVDLPDDEGELEWAQRLLHGLTDTAGQELGAAVLLDGRPVRRFAPVRGEA